MTTRIKISRLPDGVYLWERDGKYAYTWTKPPVPEGLEPILLTPWFDSPEAAKMAWEINKPEKPEESNATYKASSRYDFGWTDSRAVFGSSGV